ncbi:hypothetical protein [Gemmobacter denitrificans]|uniref:Uncharacterized protein n=1 Tax=Gemmobacter denitrificans TaxID=3123040 RepID=A0ABU8BS45_9RHOB
MRWLLILILAACGAQPSPLMFGAQRFDTVVEGRSYTLFKKDNRVEVIRLGWADPEEHPRIRATMFDLVPKLTGCSIVPSTLQGDSGAMRGRVTCPKGQQ